MSDNIELKMISVDRAIDLGKGAGYSSPDDVLDAAERIYKWLSAETALSATLEGTQVTVLPFDEYRGLDYAGASKEAGRLIKAAADSGDWIDDLPARLIDLRTIMSRRKPPLMEKTAYEASIPDV